MLVWLGSKDFNNYCSYAHLTLQEQAEAERRRGGFWCLYSWAVQRAIEENPHVESFIRSGRSAVAMFSLVSPFVNMGTCHLSAPVPMLFF